MISRCWNKRNTVLEVNKSDHGFNPRMPEIRPATWEILQKLPGKLRWNPKSCRWVRFRGFSFSIGWFFRFRFQPFIFRGVFQFGQIAEITTLWKQGSLKVWTMKFWLVGGWTNPSEKYARQLGNLPQGSGVIIKNVWNHHLATYFGWLEFAVFPLLTSYGITRPAMPPMDQRYCHSLTNQPPKPALFLPGNLQKIGSNAWGVFWWLIFKRWADGKTSLPRQNGLKTPYFANEIAKFTHHSSLKTCPAKICLLEKRSHESMKSMIYLCFLFQVPSRNISYLGKRKIIFKSAFLWDMLVPRRVSLHGINHLPNFGYQLPSLQTRPRSCFWSLS